MPQSLRVYGVPVKQGSLWTLGLGVSGALSFGPTPERGAGCLPASALADSPTHSPASTLASI